MVQHRGVLAASHYTDCSNMKSNVAIQKHCKCGIVQASLACQESDYR